MADERSEAQRLVDEYHEELARFEMWIAMGGPMSAQRANRKLALKSLDWIEQQGYDIIDFGMDQAAEEEYKRVWADIKPSADPLGTFRIRWNSSNKGWMRRQTGSLAWIIWNPRE